jgi:hypothetical protein
MFSASQYAVSIFIVLLLASLPLAMQRETGSIDGLITNEQGPIAKASIEAKGVMSGTVFRTQSDQGGYYKLESLPQGRYSLWIKAPEHDSVWVREVIVNHGRTTRRDVHLGKSRPSGVPVQSGQFDRQVEPSPV